MMSNSMKKQRPLMDGSLRNSRKHLGRTPFLSLPVAALAVAIMVLTPACVANKPDPLAATGLCAVAPTANVPPFAVEFQLRDDTNASVFIHKGCVGHEVGVSSCASGFRDRLGDSFLCACACDDPQCKGGLACGPCPEPEGTVVAPGDSLRVAFIGVSRSAEQKGNFSCARTHELPAGRYRVAVRVYDTADDAKAEVGGRTVTRDFELPAPNGVVDVPLALSTNDVCDPMPETDVPACTGSEAHDVPCALNAPLDFGWEGGLAFSTDVSAIAPPATYMLSRTFLDPGTPPRTCSAAIPRCARDARIVTTGDLVRALAEPSIAASFGPNTPVFGYDDRPSDGSVLVLRRPDGQSVALGTPCSGCEHPLTRPMETLQSILVSLSLQMSSAAPCSALRP
jgi:hypothetical protein